MKRLLIFVVVICYIIAPDLFVGPADDAIVSLGSLAYLFATTFEKDRDPKYVKMDRDF